MSNTPDPIFERLYHVEGWGQAGHANMSGFQPNPGQKCHQDLALHESTEGRFTNAGSDKRPERITRIK